ncbi:hypothetical protein [Psychromonas sp. MME2]
MDVPVLPKAFTEAGLEAGGRVVRLIDSKAVINKELLLTEQFCELKGA